MTREALIIGPLPPPSFGVATATELILHSPVLGRAFRIRHLDISDRRTVANMGRFDFTNVALAAKHELQLVAIMGRGTTDVAYLTLSQNPLAILRDWLFVATLKAWGCPIVVHLRGSGYADVYRTTAPWIRWLMRTVFRWADRVVVLGESLVPMVRCMDHEGPVDIVPNGSPKLGSHPRAVGDGRSSDRPTVLMMGGLCRAKGLDDGLLVAGTVSRRIREARFVFAGEWLSEDDRLRAERLVRDLGLEENVEFPGPVGGEVKADMLRSASAYLLTSLSEGHPWSILEAMSNGLPVVATRTGAVPDTVANGETGYLADVGDVNAMADAITRILSCDALRERLGAQAVDRHAALFTVERSHGLLRDSLSMAVDGAKLG